MQLKKHILLIDDDDLLIEVLQLTIESLGYEVESFIDAQKACDYFESNAQNFDLVISDLNMPKFSGKKLINRILASAPQIMIIITSGDLDEETKLELRNLGVKGFLQKPALRSELKEIIDNVFK